MPMDKSFEPAQIESKWYIFWEDRGYFQPPKSGTPYCILLPPPNVTGTLHMGHAFQQTIMDALIRHARMSGRKTLWQGGSDHAGIATQKMVENQLAAENTTRHQLGREAFIERVWQWKEQSGSTISNQTRRIGASIDGSRERFTMDQGLSTAVRKVFIDWYRAGLIYRGKRLVHWDPVLQTAVSDLEVNSEERQGHLWSIFYPFTDAALRGPNGEHGLTVATTRPETLLGDVAVAVHPEDERYAHLVGKTLRLPITGRAIPIIADHYVERDFGTGCVKITPAHDFNDYAIGQRHQLPLINVFTLDARVIDHLAENATGAVAVLSNTTDIGIPEKYHGLDRFEARKQILEQLDSEGLLVETQPHTLQVPISQRSEAVIEPMLTDQWFVDLTSTTLPEGRAQPVGSPGGHERITEPALEAVTSGAIKFVPESWSNTYTQWLENIQDWCISRQLWWGHRIPAWYDNDGRIFVGEDEADAIANAPVLPNGPLRQDEDVLDTWFSSALWPFSTMGWPNDSSPVVIADRSVADWREDQAFLPSAVLVTGFDIIFFWVARMVMATRYFTGKVPFHEVYINAIVRDAEGQKMSKSKGNTLDPLDLIDGIDLETLVKKSTASLLIPQARKKVEKRIRKDYPDGIQAVGTDAMRFTFAALATYGRTINFDLKRAEGYKHFCNKLWNAARFVLMNTEGFTPHDEPVLHTAAERWIDTRFRDTMQRVAGNFLNYRFDLLAQDLYQFVWNDYCDWFVELAKLALNGSDAAAATSTRHTLLAVLEGILRALHPLIPFITEEIWHEVAPRLGLQQGSILERSYPDSGQPASLPAAGSGKADLQTEPAAVAEINTLIEAVTRVRSLRSELSIAPGRPVPLLIEGRMDNPERFAAIQSMLRALCRIECIEILPENTTPPPSAATPLLGAKAHLPIEGLIDIAAEQARLRKEIHRIEQEIGKCRGKLGNPRFVANAPAEVVEQERQRLVEWSRQAEVLHEQTQRLGE